MGKMVSSIQLFQQGTCEEKWSSFERMPGGPNPPEGRGMKTLRAMAKEDGWVDLGGYTAFTIDELKQKVEEQQTPDQDMLDGLIQSLTNDQVVRRYTTESTVQSNHGFTYGLLLKKVVKVRMAE